MWHDGWMMFGGIFGFLLLIAFVFLVVWLVTRSSGVSTTSKPDPLEIAKERYARGEISHEEYEKIKKNLS
jgi:putative membrane protein